MDAEAGLGAEHAVTIGTWVTGAHRGHRGRCRDSMRASRSGRPTGTAWSGLGWGGRRDDRTGGSRLPPEIISCSVIFSACR